jgi:hypothetical protein
MNGFATIISTVCRDFISALDKIPEYTILSPADLYSLAGQVAELHAQNLGMPALTDVLFIGIKDNLLDDAIFIASQMSPVTYYEAC